MPNDERRLNLAPLRKVAKRVDDNVDSLYRNTYMTDPDRRKKLRSLQTSIDNTITDIIDQTSDTLGQSNMSRFFERISMKSGGKDSATYDELQRVFSDNDFMNNIAGAYSDNRWIRNFDDELDETIRYMPKLQEALNVLRDNVLASDSFSNNYLALSSDINVGSKSDQVSRNLEDMQTKYELKELTSEIYETASKYGEIFIYCVPYEKAIQRLLDDQKRYQSIHVQTNFREGYIAYQADSGNPDVYNIAEAALPKFSESDRDVDVTFQFTDGIIESIVSKAKFVREKLKQVNEQSLTEAYLTEGEIYSGSLQFDNTMQDDHTRSSLPKHHAFDSTIPDDFKLPKDIDGSSEGLFDVNKSKSEKLAGMNGCIIKVLKRSNITPISIDGVCLGYYYFEVANEIEAMGAVQTTGMVNTLTGIRGNGTSEALDSMQRREELIRFIANNLAGKIDTKFVNDNQELKKEIYHILKLNDDFNAAQQAGGNIRVSYIPPEDIEHIKFNYNKETGRGESDLMLSLIPAKLWVAIYITNCIAIMTRGNDKRVYYVKQSVDTNIAKTLLKTINEIKKSNFNIRQVENINSVLNITGRFNDYIIPRGSDGQSPVEFEVMQGQQIEIKSELLNLLEESAINPTGVPIELIQNRQSPDYAIQLTMSNSAFLRYVYSRQDEFKPQLSKLFTKIYNIEYNARERIKVTLPPPLFINIANTSQLINNTSEYCNAITEIVLANEQDDNLRQTFAKNLKLHYLGSYINITEVNSILEVSKQETQMNAAKNPEGEE